MIRYLTGCSTRGVEAIAARRKIGLLVQPRNAVSYCELVDRYPFWAADNGAFTRKPGGFNALAFRAMLRLPQLRARRRQCLFVVAPDQLVVKPSGAVIGDAAGTLAQFPAWARTIRRAGYPVALVAQDGLEALLDEVPWRQLDALFIGGSDGWKESAQAGRCAAEAKRRSKLVHMGRVNGLRRLRRASQMACDTADGTLLRFGPEKMLRRLEWMLDGIDAENRQAQLPFA